MRRKRKKRVTYHNYAFRAGQVFILNKWGIPMPNLQIKVIKTWRKSCKCVIRGSNLVYNLQRSSNNAFLTRTSFSSIYLWLTVWYSCKDTGLLTDRLVFQSCLWLFFIPCIPRKLMMFAYTGVAKFAYSKNHNSKFQTFSGF